MRIIIIISTINDPAQYSTMTSSRQRPEAIQTPHKSGGVSQSRLSSTELFAGSDLVVIEHQGAEYQLRITRLGKLIMTK